MDETHDNSDAFNEAGEDSSFGAPLDSPDDAGADDWSALEHDESGELPAEFGCGGVNEGEVAAADGALQAAVGRSVARHVRTHVRIEGGSNEEERPSRWSDETAGEARAGSVGEEGVGRLGGFVLDRDSRSGGAVARSLGGVILLTRMRRPRSVCHRRAACCRGRSTGAPSSSADRLRLDGLTEGHVEPDAFVVCAGVSGGFDGEQLHKRVDHHLSRVLSRDAGRGHRRHRRQARSRPAVFVRLVAHHHVRPESSLRHGTTSLVRLLRPGLRSRNFAPPVRKADFLEASQGDDLNPGTQLHCPGRLLPQPGGCSGRLWHERGVRRRGPARSLQARRLNAGRVSARRSPGPLGRGGRQRRLGVPRL